MVVVDLALGGEVPTVLGLVKACGVGLFLSGLYVGSLYLWPTGKRRDHPSTIKRRTTIACVVSALSPCVLYLVYGTSSPLVPLLTANNDAVEAAATPLLDALFLKPSLAHHVTASLKALSLFIVLFAGPILFDLWGSGFVQKVYGAQQNHLFTLRNVVVAPITEEFVYRACITAPLVPLAAHHPVLVALFGPACFGVAHAHHLIMGEPVVHILVQIAYTTLFGYLSSTVMLATQSSVAAIIVHAFCNWMELPDFAGVYEDKAKLRVVGPTFVAGLAGFLYLFASSGGQDFIFESTSASSIAFCSIVTAAATIPALWTYLTMPTSPFNSTMNNTTHPTPPASTKR